MIRLPTLRQYHMALGSIECEVAKNPLLALEECRDMKLLIEMAPNLRYEEEIIDGLYMRLNQIKQKAKGAEEKLRQDFYFS